MRIGIDLGGTKIEIIALDERGAVLACHRVPTPQGDYAATLQAIVSLVARVEADTAQVGTVGVGMPGAVSQRTGRIKNANSTCLNGQDLQGDLAARLQREVRVANDANCFALSEATDGSGAGAAVVFGVILGTGEGGGVVVGGQLIEGCNRIAGEWGHNPLAEDAPAMPCYCGRTGCVETWLCGPGMAADHLRVGFECLSAEAIAQGASRGDAGCVATLERYEARLARALAGVINILDPDVIVLGGGLSNIARLYTEVPKHLAAAVFSDAVKTRIAPAVWGDSSGARGAAWLWA